MFIINFVMDGFSEYQQYKDSQIKIEPGCPNITIKIKRSLDSLDILKTILEFIHLHDKETIQKRVILRSQALIEEKFESIGF